MDRIPTGITGLDPLIKGGLPRGSLILLAGPPGTGKTILASQILFNGAAKYGEKGIYVSFSEGKEFYYETMREFGFDFEKLEGEAMFKYLDLVTINREGVAATLEQILDEVYSMKVKRLVIDSFTAIGQAIKDQAEARMTIHSILNKMTRQVGCTTILIVEIPTGEDRIGLSIEEFVADGIIQLEMAVEGFEIRRRGLIRKMRGTNHSLKYQSVDITPRGVSFSPLVT